MSRQVVCFNTVEKVSTLCEFTDSFIDIYVSLLYCHVQCCTLGTRGFSRVRREFSVLAEGRHIFGRRPKPRAAFRAGHYKDLTRADKGWAVKRARPSKKVWCSGLGLCLQMSLVFDFGQGLRCGLYISHCRCHWIMAAWFVSLHFFLVPLCWYTVSERQMLLFFLREV